jgi:hypothetical protein
MLIASYFAAKAVYDVTVAIDGGADRPSFAVFVKHYLQE